VRSTTGPQPAPRSSAISRLNSRDSKDSPALAYASNFHLQRRVIRPGDGPRAFACLGLQLQWLRAVDNCDRNLAPAVFDPFGDKARDPSTLVAVARSALLVNRTSNCHARSARRVAEQPHMCGVQGDEAGSDRVVEDTNEGGGALRRCLTSCAGQGCRRRARTGRRLGRDLRQRRWDNDLRVAAAAPGDRGHQQRDEHGLPGDHARERKSDMAPDDSVHRVNPTGGTWCRGPYSPGGAVSTIRCPSGSSKVTPYRDQ
jgi:hypothetical protein